MALITVRRTNGSTCDESDADVAADGTDDLFFNESSDLAEQAECRCDGSIQTEGHGCDQLLFDQPKTHNLELTGDQNLCCNIDFAQASSSISGNSTFNFADSTSNLTTNNSNILAQSRNCAIRSRTGTVTSSATKLSHSLSASARLMRESFVVVKGAAVILSSNSDNVPLYAADRPGPEIQSHLKAIFNVLKPCDSIRAAVRLESKCADCIKYAAVVYRAGVESEESIVLGLDIVLLSPAVESAYSKDNPPMDADTNSGSAGRQRAFIGVVMPLFADATVKLDGDGGFSVNSNERCNVFKPVSVQAMWSILQTLERAIQIARRCLFHPAGLSHTWTSVYEVLLTDNDAIRVADWNRLDEITPTVGISGRQLGSGSETGESGQSMEQTIRMKLKEVMLTVDLEEVNTKYLRERLETELATSLAAYRTLIDEEAIVVMGQLEKASEIFDYLYLGSEWNASNWDELRANGVTHIVNVSREVDCFFPASFHYLTVRVYDTADADLLVFWDRTFRFISDAHRSGGRVLVHCKMGISRSASTVVAYCMKEHGWSLADAFRYVKRRRSCIKPNDNFMRQLAVYAGIVEASRQRHNPIFKSNRSDEQLERCDANGELSCFTLPTAADTDASGSLDARPFTGAYMRPLGADSELFSEANNSSTPAQMQFGDCSRNNSARFRHQRVSAAQQSLPCTQTIAVLDPLRFTPTLLSEIDSPLQRSASERDSYCRYRTSETNGQLYSRSLTSPTSNSMSGSSNQPSLTDNGVKIYNESNSLPSQTGAVKRQSLYLEQRTLSNAVSRLHVTVNDQSMPLETEACTSLQQSQSAQPDADLTVKPGTVRDLLRVFGVSSTIQSQSVAGTMSKHRAHSPSRLDVDKSVHARYSWPSPSGSGASYDAATTESQLSFIAQSDHVSTMQIRTSTINVDLKSSFSRNSVAYVTL